MSKVLVGDIKVGDVITEAVYDDDGKRFLPKGIKHNSALITRLRDGGVVAVVVESVDAESRWTMPKSCYRSSTIASRRWSSPAARCSRRP